MLCCHRPIVSPSAPVTSTSSAADRGLPDCHGAGVSVRRCMPDGSVIRTAKLIAGPAAEGRAVGTPAGTIRMPPVSRSGSRAADGHQSRIIQRARTRQASVPGNAERNRLPQPRPPGRRPMRSPGSPIFLFRYHAERRGRAEENARGPAVLHWNGPFGPTRWR